MIRKSEASILASIQNRISFLSTNDYNYFILKAYHSILQYRNYIKDNPEKITKGTFFPVLFMYDMFNGLRFVDGVNFDVKNRLSTVAIVAKNSNVKKSNSSMVNSNEIETGEKRFNYAIALVNGIMDKYMSQIDLPDTLKRKLSPNAILLLPDFLYYNDKMNWAFMKEAAEEGLNISFVMYGSKENIPRIMDRYITYPNLSELTDFVGDTQTHRTERLQDVLSEFNIGIKDLKFDLISRILPMTHIEFENLIIMLINTFVHESYASSESKIELLDYVSKTAWRELAKTSKLELEMNNNVWFDDIGGMEILKEDIAISSRIFKNRELAEQANVPIPKAILLQGPQGTGKTEVSKAIANELGVKFIRINLANLFGGRVGETESNFQSAVDNIQMLAPVVCLLDEADKVLSGMASSDKSDGGTTSRAIQTFTNFMAEDHAGVFLVLTANDLDDMSLEVIRKGRVDQIYMVDTPNAEAREAILNIHLKKVNTPSKIIIDIVSNQTIIDMTDNFTGAELAEAVKEAKRVAFMRNMKDPTIDVDELISIIKEIKPICISDKEKIDKLREWGRRHGKLAGGIQSSTTKSRTKKKVSPKSSDKDEYL